tara:strand:- start:515 stop:727 length:213 start_codon:yes stop_codon:yes gene_type:complete
MTIYLNLKRAILDVFESLFVSDMDVVSPEAKKIIANPEDRKLYIDAVERLKKGEVQEETIKLSTGEITIS